MKYLKIKNNGEIDPQALHLVGASTKVGDDSKIGQFGSGNKYALCYLLRNSYDIRVFAGDRELNLETKPHEFGGQTFHRVYVDGEPTSLTTQMGKDWDLWQAMRELYCNAVDEGGNTIDFTDDVTPTKGETHFYVECTADVLEFMTNFDKYFLSPSRIICEVPGYGRISHKSGKEANVYRKGIRCYDTERTSVYDYDLDDIKISEDRLVQYPWRVVPAIWDLIFNCDNEQVIRTFLARCCENFSLEGNVDDISTIYATEVSPTFLEVISSMTFAPVGMSGLLTAEEQASTCIVPTKVFNVLRELVKDNNIQDKFKLTKNNELFREYDTTPLEGEIIRKCLEFFKEVDFDIPYTIKTVKFENKKILGAAVDGEILLSDVGLERGIFDVCNTILEEYIHLKYKVKDETRDFQTASINLLLKYMQKANAIAI